MKLIKLFVLSTCLMALVACEISGPSIKVEPPKVKVDGVKVDGVKVEGSNGGGSFCPPGQAKKGNC